MEWWMVSFLTVIAVVAVVLIIVWIAIHVQPRRYLSKLALDEIIRTYQIGIKKYAKDNWKEKYTRAQLLDKAERHLDLYIISKQRYDTDDGQHNLGAVAFGIIGALEKDLRGEL